MFMKPVTEEVKYQRDSNEFTNRLNGSMSTDGTITPPTFCLDTATVKIHVITKNGHQF